MLKQTKNHADVRTTDRTRTSYTFQVTNRCGCDLCSATIISRAATGTVGSRKFQLPLWIASCIVHGSPRPAVTLTLTWPRTFIMVHFATHTHDVPAFSSPAFSTPAIWSHVFQSCLFQSRVFSVPVQSTSSTVDEFCRQRHRFALATFLTPEFWTKFQREVPLFLDVVPQISL